MASYETLSKPGSMEQPTFYTLTDSKLYDKIVMKYMMPPVSGEKTEDTKDDELHDAHMHHATAGM